MSTLPVTDLAARRDQSVTFPYVADSGGWTSQIILTNPTRSDVNRPSAVHKSVGSGFIRRAGWAGGYRLRLLDPCSRLQDICHRECFTRRAYRMDSRCPLHGSGLPDGCPDLFV